MYMYKAEKAANTAKEMERYNLESLELFEKKWTQAGRKKINSGKSIKYLNHEEKMHYILKELRCNHAS